MTLSLLKSYSTDGNIDRFGQFEPLDTIESYTISNDPTGKSYVTGTNLEDALYNVDNELARIDDLAQNPRDMFHAYLTTPIYWDFDNEGHPYGTYPLTKKIPFDVKLFDTNYMFDSGSGRFYPPTTGLYSLSAMHSWSDSATDDFGHTEIWLYKLGAPWKLLVSKRSYWFEGIHPTGGYSIASTEKYSGTIQAWINQSEYIEVYVRKYNYVGFTGRSKNTLVGRSNTWFMGYLISPEGETIPI